MKKILLTLLAGLCGLATFAQTPALILRTARATGTPMTLKMRLPAAGEVGIDWGNGTIQQHAVGKEDTSIQGLLAGAQIKIYNSQLNFLDCTDCDLVELDAAAATALQQLYCGKNLLEQLDLTGNPALVRLGCHDNRLTALNLRKNQKLTGIYMQNNALGATALNSLYTDLPRRSQMPDRVTLRVKGNPGAAVSNTASATAKNWYVDTEGNNTGGKPVTLTTTLASGTKIYLEMRLTEPGQVEIDWGNGPVKAAVDTKTTRVNGIAAGQKITIIADGLNFLKCERMGLTAIDVTNAAQLQQLYCGHNALTTIDVSANKNLTRLGINNNAVQTLDVSNNSKLSGIYMQDNKFDAKALNRTFDQLPARSKRSDVVNLRVAGNPGAERCKAGIADDKNWVVDTLQDK